MSTGGFSFESEWPDTAARLKTALRRRRIPAPLIDDLVQDTGLRLFQKWECVDPERGAWPLAYTVAMNILKDQLRSEERKKSNLPPPAPSEFDPELMALARIELERVRDALVQLSPGQRSALLAEIGECAENGRSPSAVKMLRLRARKRLRALTHEAPGVLGSIELLAQKFLERAHSVSLPGGSALAAPLAAGLLSLGLVTSQSSLQGLGGSTVDPERPGQTSTSSSAHVAQRVVDAISDASQNHGSVEAALVALKLSKDGGDSGVSATTSRSKSAGKPGSKEDGKRGGDGDAGGGGSDGVELPDDLNLEPSDGADGPPQPVTVEDGEAGAGPEGASASAGGSGAGHEASVEVGVSPGEGGSNGDSGGLPDPEVEGEAQLDGKDLLKLG